MSDKMLLDLVKNLPEEIRRYEILQFLDVESLYLLVEDSRCKEEFQRRYLGSSSILCLDILLQNRNEEMFLEYLEATKIPMYDVYARGYGIDYHLVEWIYRLCGEIDEFLDFFKDAPFCNDQGVFSEKEIAFFNSRMCLEMLYHHYDDELLDEILGWNYENYMEIIIEAQRYKEISTRYTFQLMDNLDLLEIFKGCMDRGYPVKRCIRYLSIEAQTEILVNLKDIGVPYWLHAYVKKNFAMSMIDPEFLEHPKFVEWSDIVRNVLKLTYVRQPEYETYVPIRY